MLSLTHEGREDGLADCVCSLNAAMLPLSTSSSTGRPVLVLSYLDFSRDAEWGVPRCLSVLPLLLLSLCSHQTVEVGGQVASQQCFLRRDVQQHSQRVRVKPRLQHLCEEKNFKMVCVVRLFFTP